MIPDSKIWHILPVNDLHPHIDEVKQDCIRGIYCDCPCEPDVREEEGTFFVVHSSFDGREGLEQVEEILKNP